MEIEIKDNEREKKEKLYLGIPWYDLGAESKLQYTYRLAKFILTIFLIVGIGLFIVRQFIQYQYAQQLLQTPCELCAHYNPNQSECIKGCFIVYKYDETALLKINSFNASRDFENLKTSLLNN